MPSLLIFSGPDGWFAAVSNTGVRYQFLGSTPAGQLSYARVFASEMQMGNTLNFASCFNTDVPSQQIASELLETTDELMYVDDVIYEAIDATLLEDIGPAGEALVAILA